MLELLVLKNAAECTWHRVKRMSAALYFHCLTGSDPSSHPHPPRPRENLLSRLAQISTILMLALRLSQGIFIDHLS